MNTSRSLVLPALVVTLSLYPMVDLVAAPLLIREVPHVLQKPDFCGEACVEMAVRRLGHTLTQDDVFNASGLDPSLGRGCHTAELKRALEVLGFRPGATWHRVAPNRAALQPHWQDLCEDLSNGVPSIVCMRTGTGAGATEHFRLILGYDSSDASVIYHEPAEVDAAYRRMALNEFLEQWPLHDGRKSRTLIRLRLEPGRVAGVAGRPQEVTDADIAQHVLALRKRLPKGFHMVVQKPFVVIGNESAAHVQRRAESTVKWSVERLKRAFFDRDPDHIIDIWLFKDDATYRKYAWELFRDRPDTPFGYASSEHRALVMNISTGGGTLVHEIVHPYMAANFADCPSWFNEGLGSLYEQSSGRGREIVGLTNWRLAGLQKAIKAGTVPSFKTLTDTSRDAFYEQDPGTNYAQARYLCYYLQEKSLLRTYYREFVRHHAQDPTGYETLKRVLKAKDMAAFQKRWERYVLALRFP